jgi:hypothetical protein
LLTPTRHHDILRGFDTLFFMSLRLTILNGLRSEAQGNIAKAKANVEIYLNNPAGIGEHPDVLAAIQEQLDLIAHEEERIEVVDKYFES